MRAVILIRNSACMVVAPALGRGHPLPGRCVVAVDASAEPERCMGSEGGLVPPRRHGTSSVAVGQGQGRQCCPAIWPPSWARPLNLVDVAPHARLQLAGSASPRGEAPLLRDAVWGARAVRAVASWLFSSAA